ncbi:outer membrane protein [Aestuariibius sp. 2305UL40-4]|uniref:outer membrane protein n=1 Tax=Aestuariibius violaceus TaxID=3234132 RepID=UPI00345F12B7
MHRMISLTALGFVMTSPALAGGLIEPAPEPIVQPPVVVAPPAPTFSFAGPYVGVGIGTGTFTAEGNNDFDDEAENFFNAIDDDDSAAYYQLHAGYNFVRNNFVFGPEVALFNGESELSDDVTVGNASEATDAEVDLGARLMGRAGYQFGRVMPYLTAGLTYLEIEADGDDLSDTGFAVGVGADVLVTEQFMIGVEYIQNDFDEFDDTDADVDYETIALRGSFRF